MSPADMVVDVSGYYRSRINEEIRRWRHDVIIRR